MYSDPKFDTPLARGHDHAQTAEDEPAASPQAKLRSTCAWSVNVATDTLIIPGSL